MLRVHGHRFGPADRVTLVRALLACVVAGMVAGSVVRPADVRLLVALSSVALVLDLVDGHVARRTGTVSEFGARFDLETDAFLILVLSLYVAPRFGWWVLAIGLMRYLFVAAGRVWPWLRGTTTPRPWCKVVAATQGIVLTVAAAGVLPASTTRLLLAGALALLLESFGREALELRTGAAPRRTPLRPLLLGLLAFAVVWAALVFPDRPDRLSATGLLRVPVEGVLVVAVAVLLPAGWRRTVAVSAGLLLGVLVVVKALNLAFFTVFDRPVDPLNDWYYLGPGLGVLRDTNGTAAAVGAVVVVTGLVLLVLTLLPALVLRVTEAAARRRRVTARLVTALAAVWLLAAVAGTELVPGEPVASHSASAIVSSQVDRLRDDLRDRRTFDREVAVDRWAGAPADRVLTGLRGKDVLLLFVESYGRVAVEGSSFSPGVDRVLDAGTAQLRADGWSARSAFLTSPTFGAGSWLAHATLQSGLWVDSQQRYDQLLTRDRTTLTSAFREAGWRTVVDDPANTIDWPQGRRFYGFDQLYDARNVGYAGPRFGYATMPDQYTLDAFHRLELAPHPRRPVMAEIDLISSHHSWTPLPHLVPWSDVGDGSVFDPMPALGQSAASAFRDPARVRELYGRSIEYSLSAVLGFLRTYPDPDLVVVMVGDHQPHSYVSGASPGHDVPISVIAHDPAVTRRIEGWGWRDGLNPDPAAPVWRMDLFRDRFLAAFGSQEGSTP
ncbi:CDP-alcohol phosphatidyltransferase family protein [Marmoricola sp. RAF53]|uniref:CDP-alcohol phosphatidyltransferase family protein n=1 Tax=Marmoricola sp. RAF53 TaxID=3233059 RepID=UPI003F98B37D